MEDKIRSLAIWFAIAVFLTFVSFGNGPVASVLLVGGALLLGFLSVVGYQATKMTDQLQRIAARAHPPPLITAADNIEWHHRDEPVKYKSDKRFTGATVIDSVLQDCLTYVCRDYVEYFYYTIGTHPVFVHEVQLSLQRCVINFANRAKLVDWTPFFTKRIPDDFASHLRLFRLAEERLYRDRMAGAGARDRLSPSPAPSFREEPRQYSTTSATDSLTSVSQGDLTELEQSFFAVEERMGHCLPYRDILCSVEAEKNYLRDISEFLLFLLLPDDDFESRVLRQLLKEVMVNSIILPMTESLCDVDYVNQTIVWLCKPSTFNADFFTISLAYSTSMEEVEEILRQIGIESERLRQQDSNDDPQSEAKQQLDALLHLRQTCTARLEQLKLGDDSLPDESPIVLSGSHNSLQVPSGALPSLPLMVVLNNNLALSHFCEFLEVRPEKKVVNFWLNVEAFRTSAQQLLQAKVEAQEASATSPDMEFVREMAMNIFDEYLSEASRLPCFTAPLCQHIWQTISTSRPSGDWFDVAEGEAYNHMDKTSYREFQRSEFYSHCLAELELTGRQDDHENVGFHNEDVVDDDTISIMTTAPAGAELLTASGTFVEPVNMSVPSASDEVAELSLSVPTFEAVRQAGKTVVYYTVQVFCRYVNQPNGITWHVLRRFSDFVNFNTHLKEKFDYSYDLPAKRAFGNFDKKLLERRRVGLESFLKELVAPSITADYPDILQTVVSFAHPGQYSREKTELSRRVTNLVARKVRTVRGGINERMRSSPAPGRRGTMPVGAERLDGANRPEEDIRMSDTLSAEDEDNIPLRILLLLMDEVFDLSTKNKWLRRHVIVILQTLVRRTFGDRINRKIIDQVEWLTSAEQIAEFVKVFRDSMWPDGILGPYAETRDEATKIRTQTAARTMLLGSVPEELRRFIGATATECGIVRMFNMFQSKRLNKRLFYLMLEALIETLFKDNKFPDIFKTLHPAPRGRERSGSGRSPDGRRTF